MKSYSKLFVFFFILLPIFSGCNFGKKTVEGDYEIISEKFSIADYSEIDINLPAEVIYQHHSDSLPYLQINTDRNILSHLNIRVENHKLIVEAKTDTIISPTKLIIYTTSTSIERVNLNGSGNLRLAGEVNSPDLNVILNGSGEIRTDSLLCERLRIDLNGSGNVVLVGAAGQTDFCVNGSGTIDTRRYFSEDINVDISGSGKIIEN